jgi:hypothetical protein
MGKSTTSLRWEWNWKRPWEFLITFLYYLLSWNVRRKALKNKEENSRKNERTIFQLPIELIKHIQSYIIEHEFTPTGGYCETSSERLRNWRNFLHLSNCSIWEIVRKECRIFSLNPVYSEKFVQQEAFRGLVLSKITNSKTQLSLRFLEFDFRTISLDPSCFKSILSLEFKHCIFPDNFPVIQQVDSVIIPQIRLVYQSPQNRVRFFPPSLIDIRHFSCPSAPLRESEMKIENPNDSLRSICTTLTVVELDNLAGINVSLFPQLGIRFDPKYDLSTSLKNIRKLRLLENYCPSSSCFQLDLPNLLELDCDIFAFDLSLLPSLRKLSFIDNRINSMEQFCKELINHRRIRCLAMTSVSDPSVLRSSVLRPLLRKCCELTISVANRPLTPSFEWKDLIDRESGSPMIFGEKLRFLSIPFLTSIEKAIAHHRDQLAAAPHSSLVALHFSLFPYQLTVPQFPMGLSEAFHSLRELSLRDLQQPLTDASALSTIPYLSLHRCQFQDFKFLGPSQKRVSISQCLSLRDDDLARLSQIPFVELNNCESIQRIDLLKENRFLVLRSLILVKVYEFYGENYLSVKLCPHFRGGRVIIHGRIELLEFVSNKNYPWKIENPENVLKLSAHDH